MCAALSSATLFAPIGAADDTTTTDTRFTGHARLRAAQRHLTPTDVDYIMTWGRVIRRTGVDFYVLANKDIPARHRRSSQVARLAGAVVMVSPDNTVITLYRNAEALRVIARKMKYRLTDRQLRRRPHREIEENDGDQLSGGIS